MNRTRATALALVNWKGVFYERYQLDRHVTVLEGANGAGKTTVMIAAYVVLLPDLSRLRFTNLGETAATGGDRGIHGRLGERGPAYAALELALSSGERLVAGVRLVRGTAPSVEATPFVITGLSADVRLQELFLVRDGEVDRVPELDDLKRAVKERAGTIEVFRSVKDYLALLFERGVTPLRLASEEDRTKLNEMLRTSMTGGISKALSTELRSFLLKEESGLGETLSRMRANLEACRRTRLEVAESRLLEREISGVYEAGQAMFSAALLSAREAAEEARRRAELTDATLAQAERAASELTAQAESSSARQASLDARLAATQAEVSRLVAARERRTALDSARERAAQLAREVDVRTRVADEARAAQTASAEERAARKQARERAAEAYDRASHGLAHLQAGLDELHRRAHAHRLLLGRLSEASALCGRSIALADVASEMASLGAEIERLDAERTRIERDLRDADARARDHGRALSALAELERLSPSDAEGAPHDRARSLLARLSALAERVGRLDALGRELAEAKRLAERQREAREQAARLGLNELGDGDLGGASARVVARLEELEQSARVAGEEARREDERALSARARRETLGAEHKPLSERAARWTTGSARAARLSSALGQPLTTRASVLAARDVLAERQRALTARRAELGEEREALLRRAGAVATSGELDPALLRLRDELGAELLASRYDEVDPDAATWLEAKLGPLSRALVVDDMDAALAQLKQLDHDLSTVWLVRADASIASAEGDAADAQLEGARDVVVAESFGVRVTRPAMAPTLGRRSRERQAEALRDTAEALGSELEQLAEQNRELAAQRRELDALLDDIDVLVMGDPTDELARIDAELAALVAAEPTHRAAAAAARAREAELSAQLPALRRLLAEAALLDPPDHAARRDALATDLAEANKVRDRLEAALPARRLLAECLDELRATPPDDQEREARALLRDELAQRRDVAARAHAALADALAHRYAEGWGDADEAIGASASLAPALEAQHVAAREAVQTSESQLAAAEAAWEQATAAFQAAEAERTAAVAHHARAREELVELGDGDPGLPTDDESGALARALAEANARRTQLDAEARRLVEEGVLARERASRARDTQAVAQRERDEAARAAEPLTARWLELADAARAAKLLDNVLGASDVAAQAGRGSAALLAEAQSKRELVIDRLAGARGGAQLAEQLRAQRDPLATWLEVRDWLRRRVPAQVADVAEPLDALERLRDHLDVLEGRLARQELDLRGASEDVARGIEVQLRRARGQVRRLNQHLDSVCFGSVSGVRVEMRRVERMEQILRALRDGEAQELLFLASMPIEEALDEIFRRHGGGRGGGLRLLDYREYLDLVVEVRRRGGEAWEPTSPTRLSTGEAIGVGAALMMVVLTEWERDSHLLHGRRGGGSLRFLFLDEANRLSRDNLAILFDLCRNLDLQLLVAAPEVARAEGNTTYRLIRRVGDDGREEVIVSGRRALASAATESTSPDEQTDGAEAPAELADVAEPASEPAPTADASLTLPLDLDEGPPAP